MDGETLAARHLSQEEGINAAIKGSKFSFKL